MATRCLVMRDSQITRYYAVRHLIWNGDMLVFRNGGIHATEGRSSASHIGRAVWTLDTLLCAESIEFRGGQLGPLSTRVRECPGRIDVYRPKCSHRLRECMAQLAVRQSRIRYSYAGVLRASFMHMPIARRVAGWFGIQFDPVEASHADWREPKFCSWFSIWIDREASMRCEERFEPVPGLSERYTEPGDLARSAAYERIFEGLTV